VTESDAFAKFAGLGFAKDWMNESLWCKGLAVAVMVRLAGPVRFMAMLFPAGA
jgi:hypothetical protein